MILNERSHELSIEVQKRADNNNNSSSSRSRSCSNVKKTAKNVYIALGLEQRKREGERARKGMKHQNKFQSSKLLVVWLVFLSLCFSFSHLILCMFLSAFCCSCCFRFVALFIRIYIICSPIQANIRIYMLPFPFFFCAT